MAPEFAYRLGAAARRPASWWQLLKFGLVGGSGYLINLAVFALLAGNLGVHHAIAAVGAFCVAVTSNFFWNRYWTFGARRRARRLPGRPLLRRQRRRAGDQPRRCSRRSSRAPRSATCRPGDRRRGRDAVQLPRQQALDVRLSSEGTGASAPVAQWSTAP